MKRYRQLLDRINLESAARLPTRRLGPGPVALALFPALARIDEVPTHIGVVDTHACSSHRCALVPRTRQAPAVEWGAHSARYHRIRFGTKGWRFELFHN